ncbi:glycoside hydrolase family 3 protein [Demequina sp.]|uniref:glycoside hydrolase family 3 protein n=1 Tax=Demequina sp. TaxID=2050685 RepID=UPI003A8C5F69
MSVLATLMPGFDGTELPEWVEQRLRDGMGGVCLFVSNVESVEQLRRLTDQIREANPQAIISIDEEGGDVSRLYQREGSPFPGNAVLGRLDDPEVTRAVGEQVGRELALAGINVTLAPSVDINCNPRNPIIGVRSFGAHADLVSKHGVAWTEGVQSQAVAANAKHFPGHGDTIHDSHHVEALVNADLATLRERELAPFAAAIDAGVLTIMTSHSLVPVLDPDNVATFSRPILVDLLREQMGFDGVVITDALNMAGASGAIGIPAAAVKSLVGGCDLLCIGPSVTEDELDEIVQAIDDALEAGELDQARVADAARRNSQLAAQLAQLAAHVTPDERPLGTVQGLETVALRETFAVSADARARLSARAASGAPVHWIKFESTPNIAVGEGAWGPFAAGSEAQTVVRQGDVLDVSALPSDALIVAVGKDNHRHEWIREAIDAIRPWSPVVVDMGWPEPAEPYVDIATYGASRAVGTALKELVE